MKAATEVIKQFTPMPKADYSESWVIEAMKEYAREACKAQREICADKVYELDNSDSINPKSILTAP